MKFNKTSWIFLGITIFLLAALVLGWAYFQQVDQQQQLTLQLNQARKNLAGINYADLTAKKATSSQQTDQYNVQINETKNELSSSKDSLDVTNMILADAKVYYVKIFDISSSGLGSEALTGVKCETLSVSIITFGELNDLTGFISSVSQVFPTSIVKSARMEKQIKVLDSDKPYKATISLIIYNYKGQ